MFRRFRRTGEGKRLRELQALAPTVNTLEPEIEQLDDDALRARTAEFRARVDRGESLDGLMVEAFAVVREASRRVLGQRHHDVQVVAGAALHLGWVAEMRTGEGKTLAATLPAYLHGLTGTGVHLATANDYLAERDAAWMGRLYRWLGLSVGLLVPDPRNRHTDYKREQYAADITYGAGRRFALDYLWDNTALSRDGQVQRGHHFAIVDEADAVLIDEARAPASLGQPASGSAELYNRFAVIVRGLERDTDYEVDEQQRTVLPTEAGIDKVEQALGVANLYDSRAPRLVYQLGTALQAKELYQRDEHYVIQDGKVKTVDHSTGRMGDGRWLDGLHSAVEAKEGLPVEDEQVTTAEVTLQNYFLLYDRLAGMTGTAMSDADELYDVYGLRVVPIPTNRPVARVDRSDLVYRTEDAKLNAVVKDIAERHRTGQPVLVGTTSVEKSEQLAERLKREGIPHQALDAKQNADEAEVIAQAGRRHAVTVAARMAGRGVDIRLGGDPDRLARSDLCDRDLDPDDPAAAGELSEALERCTTETAAERDKVRDLGGLYILGTERHDNRRIDNQLRGRSGRQGDPGESRFYASLEDRILQSASPGLVGWIMDRSGQNDSPLSETRGIDRALERIQTSIEQRNASSRRTVVRYDEVKHEQRLVIYALRNEVLETYSHLRELAAANRDSTDPARHTPGLRPKLLDEHLPQAVSTLTETHHLGKNGEDGGLEALRAEIRELWPSTLTAEDLAGAENADALHQQLLEDAVGYYEQHEQELTPPMMRVVECKSLLHSIDRCWRDHIYEMYHLREGLDWRSFGTNDPLPTWEKEGYELFSKMMMNLSRDFVRNVMHAEIEVKAQARPPL
jgi:preprotein translocase subunit SecA